MSIAPSLLAACRRLVTSQPAAIEDPLQEQTVGDLRVTPARAPTGLWWVWRDAAGRQVHAGLDARQFVAGNHYVLDADGFWRREKMEPGAACGDAADLTLAGHQRPAPCGESAPEPHSGGDQDHMAALPANTPAGPAATTPCADPRPGPANFESLPVADSRSGEAGRSRRAHNPEIAGSNPASATISSAERAALLDCCKDLPA